MRSNALISAASVGIFALLQTTDLSASAVPISECEFSQSYGATVSYEDHRDIGAGFVMYEQRMEDTYSGLVFVADCYSGSTLRIDYSGQDSDEVQSFVLIAAASPEQVTLSKLREHFSSSGLWTKLDVQNREHCACAVFYPEAKGKKANWETRYEHP